GELRVELGQHLLAGRIDEEAGDPIQEVVPRRAVDRPGVAQRLARLEDLLDDDPCVRTVGAQAFEIRLGIPETVGMVDAQAVERAVGQPAEDEPVRVPEDVLVLDPQPDEAVEVEEPTRGTSATIGWRIYPGRPMHRPSLREAVGPGTPVGRPTDFRYLPLDARCPGDIHMAFDPRAGPSSDGT